jgi:4-methylaminobutanoate oxidase (formaldehyde-forming)
LYRDGVVVGDVRAASYGHTLGGAVGLAFVDAGLIQSKGSISSGEGEEEGEGEGGKHEVCYVTKKFVDSAVWEVDVAGVRYPAEVSLKPMYDPTNSKIKA